jgi:hypothetical protein
VNLDRLTLNLFRSSLLLAAILPVIPDQLSLRTALFSLSFGALGVCWALGMARGGRRPRPSPAAWALAGFLLWALASFAVGLSRGVTPSDWLRGAIPFVFLGLFFVLTSLPITDRAPLINAVHLACLAWAAKSFWKMTQYGEQLLNCKIARLTHADFDLILPYGLIGFILTLFNPDPRFARWRWGLLAVFGLLVAGSGYRSLSLLCLAVFAFYWLRQPPRQKLALAGGAVVCAALVFALSGKMCVVASHGQQLAARFAKTGSPTGSGQADRERMTEVRYALESFARSPLTGNGLGYGVPIAALGGRSGKAVVGFIHNVWAYLLMDLGVVGFAAYVAFILLPVCRAWRARRRLDARQRACALAAALVVAGLMAFATVSATFRLIQTNLILATLAAVMDGAFADGDSETEARG